MSEPRPRYQADPALAASLALQAPIPGLESPRDAEREREALIDAILDGPVSPYEVMTLLVRTRGPGVLTNEALRVVAEIQALARGRHP